MKKKSKHAAGLYEENWFSAHQNSTACGGWLVKKKGATQLCTCRKEKSVINMI
jgi:hypothetical protein